MNVFAARTVEELNAMYGVGMISGPAHRAAVAYVETHKSEFDPTLSTPESAGLALELSKGLLEVLGAHRVRVREGHLLAGTRGVLVAEVPDVPGVYTVETTQPPPARKFPLLGESFRISLTDLEGEHGDSAL